MPARSGHLGQMCNLYKYGSLCFSASRCLPAVLECGVGHGDSDTCGLVFWLRKVPVSELETLCDWRGGPDSWCEGKVEEPDGPGAARRLRPVWNRECCQASPWPGHLHLSSPPVSRDSWSAEPPAFLAVVTVTSSGTALSTRRRSEVAQSCPTLCDPMDYSPPGSCVHWIFQARVLEWVAISFSRVSSRPRDQNWVSHIAGRRFTIWATREIHSPFTRRRSY